MIKKLALMIFVIAILSTANAELSVDWINYATEIAVSSRLGGDFAV